MGEIENIERYLRQHPIFKNMDPAACKAVAECAAKEGFKGGEYIIREGQLADKFYLLRHGSVALEVQAR